MKKIFSIISVLYLLTGEAVHATAQTSLKCGIYFDYDLAGNRIKRYYDCKNTTTPVPGPVANMRQVIKHDDTITDATSHEVQFYPNPTSGVYTVKLAFLPREPIHFHWYNQQGQILGSGIIKDKQFSGTIDGLPNGAYIFTLYMINKPLTFRVIKIDGINSK